MEKYQLSPEQIASLKALHRTLRDRKKDDRVKAVVLLGMGCPVAQVAEILFLEYPFHGWRIQNQGALADNAVEGVSA